MGQFEKIVVLVAFFLVTVILVVTFSSSREEGMELSMESAEELAASPGDVSTIEPSGAAGGLYEEASSNTAGLDSENVSRRDREVSSGTSEESGDLLLDDSFEVRARADEDLPDGAALITLDGLTPTFDRSIMEYAWQRGDNWVIVAKRLYGDHTKSALLRQFNEGNNYHAPGERVLVPVFDLRDEIGSGKTSKTPSAERATQEFSKERGNLYTTVAGDSLWVISKKVYGRGALWEKIYEENKVILPSPDDLKPGMELRIP